MVCGAFARCCCGRRLSVGLAGEEVEAVDEIVEAAAAKAWM